jgi:catechol 2,3-dioxygenase-like lactoylglutathione lyase family enzyme
MNKPITPRGINHLVLNVRDMEESHRFWTEIVGFREVGRLTPQPDRPNPPDMSRTATCRRRPRSGPCSACPVP